MPLLMQAVKFQDITCSNGLLVLIPLPPQKTQLSLKPRLVIDELPNSAISFRASSFNLEKNREVCMWIKYMPLELSLLSAPVCFDLI